MAFLGFVIGLYNAVIGSLVLSSSVLLICLIVWISWVLGLVRIFMMRLLS